MGLDDGAGDLDINIPHTIVTAGDMSPGMLGFKGSSFQLGGYYCLDRPSTPPLILNYGTQAAPVSLPTLPAAGDAVDTLGVMMFQRPFAPPIEMYHTTAQALKPLVHASKGLEIALDQVNNESVEYVIGGNRASNPFAYIAGTDPGVFIRIRLEITTNNGIDQLVVGFRKQENYVVPGATGFYNGQAPTYTDFAAMGFGAAVSSPNLIRAMTATASGTTIATSTAFGVTSGMIVQLEVRIRGRKASYFINGVKVGDTVKKDGVGTAITAQPTSVVPDYTFVSALNLIPFIFIRQDAGLSTVFLRRLEGGALDQIAGNVMKTKHD